MVYKLFIHYYILMARKEETDPFIHNLPLVLLSDPFIHNIILRQDPFIYLPLILNSLIDPIVHFALIYSRPVIF